MKLEKGDYIVLARTGNIAKVLEITKDYKYGVLIIRMRVLCDGKFTYQYEKTLKPKKKFMNHNLLIPTIDYKHDWKWIKMKYNTEDILRWIWYRRSE